MGSSSYLSASSESEIYFRTMRISERNTETLCDMGIHSPPISLKQACSILLTMTWAFHFSAMFSSVIKAKNLQLYKKLQNLLSLFQKLKSRLISALQTHMSLRPLKCYLLSIFWVLPLWNPLRIKKLYSCVPKKCVPERFGAKKPLNLPDLFTIGPAKNKSVFGRDA